MPKLRDRVVLEAAIRDAVAKLDPSFGYADRFDEAAGGYRNLVWAKNPPPGEAEPARAERRAPFFLNKSDKSDRSDKTNSGGHFCCPT